MSISTALTKIDLSLDAAPVEHPDAWIPMRYADLDAIRSALRHAQRLETGLHHIINDLQASLAPAANGTPAQAPPPTSEIPESTDDDTDATFDWPAIAQDLANSNFAGYFAHMAAGNVTWRKLEADTQRTMILIVIATLHQRFGRVTGPLWDKHRPDGFPRNTTLYSHMPFTEWVELALATFAFDWPAIAQDLANSNFAGYFAHMAAGNVTWRKLEADTQRTMILIVIATLHQRFGRVTGPLWDKHRPDGFPRNTTLYSHMPFTEWVELALATFAGPEDAGDDFRSE